MLDGVQLPITSEGETGTVTIELTSSTIIIPYEYLDEINLVGTEAVFIRQ